MSAVPNLAICRICINSSNFTSLHFSLFFSRNEGTFYQEVRSRAAIRQLQYNIDKLLSPTGARDCRVSDWTSWTACSNDCGVGVMKRKRFIIETPQNGGKACPALRQKRGCALYQCKRKSRKQAQHVCWFPQFPQFKNFLPTRDTLQCRGSPVILHCKDQENL